MDDLSQGIAGSSNTAPVIAQVQASASSSGGSDSLSSGDVSATSVKTFAQAAGGVWNDIRAIIQHVILWQIICNNTKSGIMKTGIIRIQP